MSVKLIHCTPDAEKHIAYCARVSSPNQENPNYEGLLKYCIKHRHWSVFELATLCLEIETSRAIAQQILRHRSFNFQEFSQRYSEATSIQIYDARRQDEKNRQNSTDDMSDEDKIWFTNAQLEISDRSLSLYKEALSKNIAKEQARFLLPLATTTKMYMIGNLRNWIHYIDLRTANGTQLEHMEIAQQAKDIFIDNFPVISKALEWKE
jgi:thymidylate synthase (FAD)